uniref:Transposase n=1 Tax=Ascaris lumbricoides TaxID=6252 RepID=A0A0M3I3F1_ASCLU
MRITLLLLNCRILWSRFAFSLYDIHHYRTAM